MTCGFDCRRPDRFVYLSAYSMKPMNRQELISWANVQVEDCLRYYPRFPPDAIKQIIADHLRDAYSLGLQETQFNARK